MKLFLKTVVCIVIVLVVYIVVRSVYIKHVPPQQSATQQITGCYVENLARDIYTLDITSEQGSAVSGTLIFNNAEKDSSHGTFVGTYTDGVLLAEYSFSSEGMDSIRQVIFKKTDAGFVEGFGPTTTNGNKESLQDPMHATFDESHIFTPSESCIHAS